MGGNTAMRLTLLASLSVVLGLAGGLGAADEKAARHVEKAGGFSFVPPKDWTMRDVGIASIKYKAAIGPAANGFAPNIVFVDEAYKGTLADYMAANKKSLAKVFKNYKELGEKNLKTEGGADMIMLVIQREDNGKMLRQTFYFVDLSPEKKMVATCSALTDGGDKLDGLFETSLKSFRVEK
jgi:hypothetical protein